jgi:hypothetical protein
MAFSDWSLIGGYGSNVDSAYLNSNLSPSLVSGSNYCRYFSVANGGSAWATRGYSASQTVAAGALYNVPNSKAIRIQGYLRISSISSGNSRSGAWLGAKIIDSFNTSGNNSLSSYCFGIRAGGSSTLQLSVMLAGDCADLGSLSFDTWYGLRLDIFPIGTAGDRIVAYKESSPGTGIWPSVFETTISSTAGNFIPWGQNRKNGFFFLQEQQNFGVVSGFSDLISVSVATAPTPTP